MRCSLRLHAREIALLQGGDWRAMAFAGVAIAVVGDIVVLKLEADGLSAAAAAY